MATQRRTTGTRKRISGAPTKSVTRERAVRLYRLLTLLQEGPQMRPFLIRRLRQDLRGFYRDLQTLREAGIRLKMAERRYLLVTPFREATQLLPLPDPHLSVGEAMQLAKGRSATHRRLRAQVQEILRSEK